MNFPPDHSTPPWSEGLGIAWAHLHKRMVTWGHTDLEDVHLLWWVLCDIDGANLIRRAGANLEQLDRELHHVLPTKSKTVAGQISYTQHISIFLDAAMEYAASLKRPLDGACLAVALMTFPGTPRELLQRHIHFYVLHDLLFQPMVIRRWIDRIMDWMGQNHTTEINSAWQAPGSGWSLVFHNDSTTSMEFVLQILEEHLELTETAAFRTMLEVHQYGSQRVGQFTREVAEARLARIHNWIQHSGSSLKVSLSKY